MIGIYKITSPSNKVYIGQSIDIEKRFYYYKGLFCKSQRILYNSLLKYGIEKHKFEILEECLTDSLNERERHYQEFFNCISKNGLNCKLTTTNDKSGKYSNSTKEKMRLSMLGKNKGVKQSDEHIKKRTLSNTGKKRSDNHIKFMSKSRMGENNPMFGKSIKESSKQLQRYKLSGKQNYLSKWLINLQTGIFYECLREAGDSISMEKRTLWVNICKSKKNKTNFIYA